METLLNAVGQRRFDGASDCRQEGNFRLYVFRQRANDQNARDEHNRADEEQQLRPATHRDEIESRIRATEDEHLPEIFEHEEGNERHDSHR